MKVLLLDTAFAALPIYEGLLEFGCDVWVAGNRPHDILAQKAGHRWIQQDYSDATSMQKTVDEIGFDAVVPGCTDVSIDVCTRIPRGRRFLDSAEVNQTLGHKGRFRELCARLEAPSPRVVSVDSFPMEGAFICKPVDSFSGRGIRKFDGLNLDELSCAVSHALAASPLKDFLIETYVGSDLYSCSGFIENRKFRERFFVREGSSANAFAVDTSYLVEESDIDPAGLLVAALEKISAFLKLKDGLLHCQFILSEAGVHIIELSRRCPGDLYPLLIEFSTGFRYGRTYAGYAVGRPSKTSLGRRRYVVRHTVTADVKGFYDGLRFRGSAEVIAFYPLARVGEELLPRQGNRAGVLFCAYSDRQEMLNGYAGFLGREAYEVVGA